MKEDEREGGLSSDQKRVVSAKGAHMPGKGDESIDCLPWGGPKLIQVMERGLSETSGESHIETPSKAPSLLLGNREHRARDQILGAHQVLLLRARDGKIKASAKHEQDPAMAPSTLRVALPKKRL